jgi:galactokinase
VRTKKFKLLRRTRHVLSESARVCAFKQYAKKSVDDPDDFYKRLGDLMNESQQSCRDDFECSCAELDELCQIARQNGAYGARLTGMSFCFAINCQALDGVGRS